ncbi:MAG TPA: adenylosuccinate lyase [Candidatus Pacearchaeota archaeon]|nr:adenylosuccinate lyase [Candidatus Pacearchaeota archaeon]HPR80208.1 adenylosuccinate lyase [Candidatus Pacearchaeota archaeon]
MISRYTNERMAKIWSENYKFTTWLKVEIAVLKARKDLGEFKYNIPHVDKIKINSDEINRIEKEITKHDVVAFLEYISPQFPEELRPWLHRGLTSYDVVDTAQSLQLRESINLIQDALTDLMEIVEAKALENIHAVQIGRTHGIHAEPITFGVKLINWYAELKRHKERLESLKIRVSVGKISGAVGMYTLDPKVEVITCEKLGLKPIIATQIISRDIIAEYMAVLGLIAGTVSKISVSMRLMAQTEIGEVMESFSKDQKGSSAMPHKKNPIGWENLTGLMRIVCSNVQVSYGNLSDCWNERSLDNSGPERVILPDSSALVEYGLKRLASIFRKMRVSKERMKENLELTKGLIFSQEVMMLVSEKSGLPRERAHTLVRDIALECWETKEDFYTALLRNEEIMKFINPDELHECFDIEKKIRYTNQIFNQIIIL